MKALLRRMVFAAPLLLLACTTSGQHGAKDLKNMPVVVAYSLAPGAMAKRGVTAVSDTGGILFSPMVQMSFNESINGYYGGLNGAFPRRVRVTWRTGDDIDFDKINGGWKGGRVVGDYTVDVLDRIPEDVFAYTRAKRGRSIVLHFRLKDDGVQFAWDVQEASAIGHVWIYKLRGGDF
jgi:hypothetical protein